MLGNSLSAIALTALAVLPTASAGIYPKSSPVLQVDAKNYDKLIAKSNYTSIVEFYAPWCGHCQNLKPAYEKAAKSLDGLANVAAVNCDEDENKGLCGSMGIQGFPTLKIVRPATSSNDSTDKKKKQKKKKAAVEDYQGPRTATGIVDAVIDRLNNHVRRVGDKDIDAFTTEDRDHPKALLFSDKGTTTPLLKGIATEFLDVITVGQVRNKEAKTVAKFGVDKFPTLVLLPGGDADPIVYDGELKKKPIIEFLSQAGAPNSARSGSKAGKNNSSSSKPKKAKASEAPSPEPEEAPADATNKAKQATTVAPITAVTSHDELTKACLHARAHTCVLAFVPADHGDKAQQALTSLAELAHKYAQGQRKLFPIIEVALEDGAAASALRKTLGLEGTVELVAVNARRNWLRRFSGDLDAAGIESWIDKIRMGEGDKEKLPQGLVVDDKEEKKEEL